MTQMMPADRERRRRARAAARKAVDHIEAALRDRHAEIREVSVSGENHMLACDIDGPALVSHPTGLQRITITIEVYRKPKIRKTL